MSLRPGQRWLCPQVSSRWPLRLAAYTLLRRPRVAGTVSARLRRAGRRSRPGYCAVSAGVQQHPISLRLTPSSLAPAGRAGDGGAEVYSELPTVQGPAARPPAWRRFRQCGVRSLRSTRIRTAWPVSVGQIAPRTLPAAGYRGLGGVADLVPPAAGQ